MARAGSANFYEGSKLPLSLTTYMLIQAKECIESDDKEGAVETLKDLLRQFESDESPPDFD